MSYARNLLSRGEEVIFESRQHWFAVVAQTWLYIIVAILALAVLIWTSTSEPETLLSILQVISLVGLLGSLALIGIRIWAWRNQEYLITNRRVIKAEGILNKTMRDSNLEKVNDAHLSQSWIGRIFDFGTLDILTAAEEVGGAIDDFVLLAEPVQFKIAMLNAKERLERPELAPPPPQRPGPAPDLRRAEPMPPRAGSDRVHEVRDVPLPQRVDPPAAEVAATAPAASSAAPPDPERRSPGDQLTATLESLAGLRDRGLITAEEYDAKKRELLERM